LTSSGAPVIQTPPKAVFYHLSPICHEDISFP
jgi:hypothetical protein